MDNKNTPNNDAVRLREELTGLIQDVDAEGLLYLIEQVNVIKYNMQVDRINQEREKLLNSDLNQNKTKVAESGKTAGEKIQIFAGENNDYFVIQVGTLRKFFSKEDFRGIVKIVQSEGEVSEIADRLFRWLTRERKDFLIENDIRERSDYRLKDLIQLVKGKYKVK